MAEQHEQALSLAFMRGHPEQAARVLDALPVDEAALLFDRAPARVGASVLAAMLPRRAASCITALPDARALELLAPMGTQAAVSVLRHLPEPRRRVLIADLPTAASLASSLLLGFTEDTVGAWADPDIVMLAPETRAADALERMRQSAAAHSQLFVADAERRLSGVVSLAALLRAPADTTLGSLMQPTAEVLAAHAPLSSAPAHPGWEHSSVLAVVEPGERLIGVMTRDALARAVRRSMPPPAPDGDATLPALLARGYWQTLTALIASGLALLPRVACVEEKRDGR
jgi:magnesium transporter